MKFTSEDLMKAMGLQVGDRIKINDSIYTVELNDYDEPIYMDEYSKIKFPITDLVNRNYEILPKPKCVGDLKCDDFECTDCPLQYLCCLNDWGFQTNDNLFNILELFNCTDDEMHNLLKARLDKVVVE